jgi:hypothetical protein
MARRSDWSWSIEGSISKVLYCAREDGLSHVLEMLVGQPSRTWFCLYCGRVIDSTDRGALVLALFSDPGARLLGVCPTCGQCAGGLRAAFGTDDFFVPALALPGLVRGMMRVRSEYVASEKGHFRK